MKRFYWMNSVKMNNKWISSNDKKHEWSILISSGREKERISRKNPCILKHINLDRQVIVVLIIHHIIHTDETCQSTFGRPEVPENESNKASEYFNHNSEAYSFINTNLPIESLRARRAGNDSNKTSEHYCRILEA